MKRLIVCLYLLLATFSLAQNTKISQLPAGAPAQANDLLPAARSGSNVSLKVSDIIGFLSAANVNAIYANADAVIHGITVGLGGGAQPYNIAFGYQALLSNTTGTENLAIGGHTQQHATTGSYNLALGTSAMAAGIATGNYNIALGVSSLEDNTSGANNMAIGGSSLFSNTTGSDNIAIGYQAGYTASPSNANVSGSQNTWIGSNTGPSSATQLTNATAIGYAALNTASNQVVIGDSAVTSVIIGGLGPLQSGAFAPVPVEGSGTLSSSGDPGAILVVTGLTFSSASYFVAITRTGPPAGNGNGILYVTNQTATGFTIVSTDTTEDGSAISWAAY